MRAYRAGVAPAAEGADMEEAVLVELGDGRSLHPGVGRSQLGARGPG